MSEITETNEVEEKKLTITQRLANLIRVKSIVTIMLSSAFTYLSVIGKIGTEQFMTVFVTVIAFYYGTQAKKA